ncbi:MAG: hypothetical protein FWG66_06745 [Spirochaetes bacterium]|nr:hypothetical protein [Spirochaetota bacterium]
MNYEQCRDILLRESEMVQKIADTQKTIQDAVSGRQWDVFEAGFASMKTMEGELAAIEEERERLFLDFEIEGAGAAVNAGEDAGDENAGAGDSKAKFFAMVALLPEEEREDLTGLYRELKLKTVKLRLSNDAFLAYLSSIKDSLKEFFDFAFPDRSGKTYTPQGRAQSHDMKSMVLNHRF